MARRHSPARALACALFLSAPLASAGEPEPVIEYYTDQAPPPRARLQLIGIGALTAAVSYGAALGASYAYDSDPYASDLRIPVIGPWMKLGHTQLCPSTTEAGAPPCNNVSQVMGAVLVGIDGLLQAGSIALLIEGIFLSTREGPDERAARFSPRPLHQLRLGEFALTPSFSAVPSAETSFGFVGTF